MVICSTHCCTVPFAFAFSAGLLVSGMALAAENNERTSANIVRYLQPADTKAKSMSTLVNAVLSSPHQKHTNGGRLFTGELL